jgi:PD-(D/E)XK nuclease superfamily
VSDERFTLPPLPAGFLHVGEPGTITQLADEAWLDGYIRHFSASGLRLLKVCPEAWRQRYILGKKERPGEALVLGSAVHDAVGFSHRQKIESHEDLPVKEVVEFFHDKAWPEAVAEDGGESEIRWDNKPADVRRDGERVTQAYHTVVSPSVQPIAVERKIEFVVPGVPVPFIGYVDWEEELNCDDLKTGKQVQRKPDANWRTQGMIYTAATGKPTHFHSASRAKTPSIATPLTDEAMIVNLREAQRSTVETILLHYAMDVQTLFERHGPDEHWPTTGILMDYKGGAACNFCGFRRNCPAWAWEREIPTDVAKILGQPITMPS